MTPLPFTAKRTCAATDPLEVPVQLIVLSNRRRKYLGQALMSIRWHVTGVDSILIVDDSGDPEHHAWLDGTGLQWAAVAPEATGYTTAMRRVFELAQGAHVALWEEDFIATAPIDLDRMAGMLDEGPYLAEVVCQRPPWFSYEVAAGGVVADNEARGHRFDLVDGLLEHRAFWSTNPCVIPRRTLEHDYPAGTWSESVFGYELLRDPGLRFGLLPDISVEHVGERSGYGY